MGMETTKIEMTVTVEMTDHQIREWSKDNDVPVSEVVGDIRSYVHHNLLASSKAREDYWTNVNVRAIAPPHA